MAILLSTSASKVNVKCQRCGEIFIARVADRKRGWARFCSKRCKAIKQAYGSNTYKPEATND